MRAEPRRAAGSEPRLTCPPCVCPLILFVSDAAKKLMGEVLALPPEDRRWLRDQLVEVVRDEGEVGEEVRRTCSRVLVCSPQVGAGAHAQQRANDTGHRGESKRVQGPARSYERSEA